MKLPRILTVFFCAALGLFALAVLKALLISGLHTMPPVKVLVFAPSVFGLVAAMIDWAVLRDLFPRTSGSILDRARQRPIVFREICPPPSAPGLSFYGGAPVGPATLAWPRARKKPGEALSFVMQWDCAALAAQDTTGLLPRDGALYLFADLKWGDSFDFQFLHAPGPVRGWQRLALPDGLPPIFGDDGAYQAPWCSPRVAKDIQDVPVLLPKWFFAPIAFPYPAPERKPGEEWEGLYWNDGERTAEALLGVEHPLAEPRAKAQSRFGRPFPGFPHDYAAVRVVAAKLLEKLRREPVDGLKNEAAERYAMAAAHRPGGRLGASESDEMWEWMEGLEPVLALGWGELVGECVNVSLGLESDGIGLIPAELLAACAESHRLAFAQPRFAPCPNHMFGPASYVQGDAAEYLDEWVLLLELSSRRPIGHEFGEGVLQFLIRPGDLRERRWERAKLIASAY